MPLPLPCLLKEEKGERGFPIKLLVALATDLGLCSLLVLLDLVFLSFLVGCVRNIL